MLLKLNQMYACLSTIPLILKRQILLIAIFTKIKVNEFHEIEDNFQSKGASATKLALSGL